MSVVIHTNDATKGKPFVADGKVQTVVTSPPYWGLRDYGHPGQLGLERTPEEYVARIVAVFEEVRRTLRDNGTLWLNLGDCYVDSGRGTDAGSTLQGSRRNQQESRRTRVRETARTGLRPKNLIGIPWRVAFALQAAGWYLRSDIIWNKPNPMPESVTDRPTRAHEYLFLFSKSKRYYYDAAAIRTPAKASTIARLSQRIDQQEGSDRAHAGAKINGKMKALIRLDKQRGHSRKHAGFNARWDAMTREEQQALGANARSVWTIATRPFAGAHFATFPPDLAERCILAGSKPGDVVLDPFAGAGTSGMVADRLGRDAILNEINPDYVTLQWDRIRADRAARAETEQRARA